MKLLAAVVLSFVIVDFVTTQNGNLNQFNGVYRAMCGSNINDATKERRVRCVLRSVPRRFQPIANQCRRSLNNRLQRQLQDLEFLNQLCYDYNSQVSFASCTYTTALNRYPFLRILGISRKRRQADNFENYGFEQDNGEEQGRGLSSGNNMAASYIKAIVSRCVSQNP